MRFRHYYNGLFLLTLLLFVHMTEPNTAIKPSIVDYLLALKSVGASGDTAVKRGPKDGYRIHPKDGHRVQSRD